MMTTSRTTRILHSLSYSVLRITSARVWEFRVPDCISRRRCGTCFSWLEARVGGRSSFRCYIVSGTPPRRLNFVRHMQEGAWQRVTRRKSRFI